jgi:hypothetical protein
MAGTSPRAPYGGGQRQKVAVDWVAPSAMLGGTLIHFSRCTVSLVGSSVNRMQIKLELLQI